MKDLIPRNYLALALPLLLGFAHGVSDAGAALLVAQTIVSASPDAGLRILLYNGLAFGFQPVMGLLIDRLERPKAGAAIGLLLSAAALLSFAHNPRLGMALAGFGSALLHAGGGSLAITATPGRAAAPGMFAACGVIGLAFGFWIGLSPSAATTELAGAALVVLALITWLVPQSSARTPSATLASMHTFNILAVGALLVAVGLRSFVWTGISAVITSGGQAALALALAAGLGKLIGGFVADASGWHRFAPVSVALALALLLSDNLLIGAAVLQSSTALSMAAMGRLFPRSPALAASLSLGAGVALGGLPFMLMPGGGFGIAPLIVALLLSGGLYWMGLRERELRTEN